MHYERLDKLVQHLSRRRGVIGMGEYRKAQLVCGLLVRAYGVVTSRDFELFMDKADLLEASVYEQLKLEMVGCGRSEAWLRTEVFKRMKKYLSDLPVFSTG